MRLKILGPSAIIFFFFSRIGPYNLCKTVANLIVTQFINASIFFQPYNSAIRTDDDLCNGNLLTNEYHLFNLKMVLRCSGCSESPNEKHVFLIPSSVSNLSTTVFSHFAEITSVKYIFPANYSQ